MSIPTIMRRVHAMTGLSLPEESVARAMAQRMRACGLATRAEYASLVLQQQAELDALVELLVVPESWFFRDVDAFHAAVKVARQSLARRAGPVRMLSLPCACGEEAYSLAMAMHDNGLVQSDFRIEGIDISDNAIGHAQLAIYRRNAFRSQDLAFRDRHFDAEQGAYRLHADVRKLVEFRKGNLLDATSVNGMYDIVFCRNLLIYFDETSQQAAIRRLKSLLAPDGVLFVGYAEAATFLRDHEFEAAPYAKAFALQRRQAAPDRNASPGLAASGPAEAMHMMHVHSPAIRIDHKMPAPSPAQAALPAASPARSHEHDNDALAQARALADCGAIDASLAAYRDILARHPNCAEACFMLGLLSERRHEVQAAETYLRRAVYLDPDHYEALCHLALLAEGRGSRSMADALRQRAERVYRRRSPTDQRNDS